MKVHTACFYALVLLVYKVSSETNGSPLDPEKVNEIKDEILERVLTPDDNSLQTQVKTKLVDYLVESTLEEYQEKHPRPRQEDTAEAAEVPENQDVYNGVRRILQNVFTGNLVGVIQESVSIRSPGAVQTFFADIMGAIFGSNAVKGAGTIGLPTPQPQNATVNGTAVTAETVTTPAPIKEANSNSDADDEGDENDDF